MRTYLWLSIQVILDLLFENKGELIMKKFFYSIEVFLTRSEFLLKNIFRVSVVYYLIELSTTMPSTWEIEQELSRVQQDISATSSNTDDISDKLDVLSANVQALNYR